MLACGCTRYLGTEVYCSSCYHPQHMHDTRPAMTFLNDRFQAAAGGVAGGPVASTSNAVWPRLSVAQAVRYSEGSRLQRTSPIRSRNRRTIGGASRMGRPPQTVEQVVVLLPSVRLTRPFRWNRYLIVERVRQNFYGSAMPATNFAFDNEQNHENTILSSVASRELHSQSARRIYEQFGLGQKKFVSSLTTEAELDALLNKAFPVLADRQTQCGVVYHSGSLHDVNAQNL